MRYVMYVFWAIILVIGIIFASLNPHSVDLNYYFATANLPVPVVVLIGLILGAILGVFSTYKSLFTAKNTSRKLRKQVKRLEQALKAEKEKPVVVQDNSGLNSGLNLGHNASHPQQHLQHKNKS